MSFLFPLLLKRGLVYKVTGTVNTRMWISKTRIKHEIFFDSRVNLHNWPQNGCGQFGLLGSKARPTHKHSQHSHSVSPYCTGAWFMVVFLQSSAMEVRHSQHSHSFSPTGAWFMVGIFSKSCFPECFLTELQNLSSITETSWPGRAVQT